MGLLFSLQTSYHMNMDHEDEDKAQFGLTHDNAPNELTNDTFNNSLDVRNVERESIEQELETEPEMLEKAAEEQELYEKLGQLTQDAFIKKF